MIELEKLYESAQTYLLGNLLNWEEFSREFEEIFTSKMALYRPKMETEVMDLVSTDEIVATTSPKMMAQYFRDKIYLNNDFLEDPKIPFEPIRRTDSLTDDQLRGLDFFVPFLKPHGIFHMMVVYAVLSDGTFLVLFVWRNDSQPDFSDIEKQRLALFMRHLATIVDASVATLAHTPDKSIQGFGSKYGLTSAETGVLSLLIQGQSLRFIAQDTNRSYGTVRWHVHNILEKCQVKTQQGLLSAFYRLITH